MPGRTIEDQFREVLDALRGTPVLPMPAAEQLYLQVVDLSKAVDLLHEHDDTRHNLVQLQAETREAVIAALQSAHRARIDDPRAAALSEDDLARILTTTPASATPASSADPASADPDPAASSC